jgi:hypothetical protein
LLRSHLVEAALIALDGYSCAHIGLKSKNPGLLAGILYV